MEKSKFQFNEDSSHTGGSNKKIKYSRRTSCVPHLVYKFVSIFSVMQHDNKDNIIRKHRPRGGFQSTGTARVACLSGKEEELE